MLSNLAEEPDSAILAVYLAGNYVQLDDRARELYAPFDFADRELIEELSTVMADASICGLGQAAPNPIRCVMKYFPHEVGAPVTK